MEAWAYWYLLQTSHLNCPGEGFKVGSHESRNPAAYFQNRKKLLQKLEATTIEERDFEELIRDLDRDGVFLFVDPPYPGADHDGYHPFSLTDYDRLLRCLAGLTKAKYLLTTYTAGQENELLNPVWQEHYELNNSASFTQAGGTGKKKVESFFANFVPDVKQTLF